MLFSCNSVQTFRRSLRLKRMRLETQPLVYNWRGIKSRFATQILYYIGNTAVAEPFGGTGSVVSANPFGGSWNDIDEGLFRVATEIQRSYRFYEDCCSLSPRDQTEADELLSHIRSMNRGQIPGALFAWGNCCTFGGMLEGRVYWDEKDGRRRRRWDSYCAQIPLKQKTWSNICVSNQDYKEFIESVSPTPLFVDPPYPGTVTAGYTATVDFTEMDSILESYPGVVFRAGYENDCRWPRILLGSIGGRENFLFARDGFG